MNIVKINNLSHPTKKVRRKRLTFCKICGYTLFETKIRDKN